MTSDKDLAPASLRHERLRRDVLDHRQARLWLAEHLTGNWSLRRERAVARRLRTPRMSGRPGRGEIWAVGMVRDEADIVVASIEHLLGQGIDHVLVSDHGSIDGTRELLESLSQSDPRVHVADDREPGQYQREKTTHLARLAWRHGAEWIVPFDADELWFAEQDTLAVFLKRQTASIVQAPVHNFIPTDESTDEELHLRVFAGDRSSTDDPKVAFRAHPLAMLWSGNHGVLRSGTRAGGLRVAHLPYRSEAQLRRKFASGTEALEAEDAAPWIGFHWRAGARLDAEGLWKEVVAGRRVAEIGWHPSGKWVHATILRWDSWNTRADQPWITSALRSDAAVTSEDSARSLTRWASALRRRIKRIGSGRSTR